MRGIGVLVGIVLLTAAPRPADACSCSGVDKVCQAITDTVFVGTVRSITKVSADVTNVVVDVHEVLRGVLGRIATIRQDDRGTCDFSDYTVGERMLIFATRIPRGDLSVSLCGGAAPAAEKAAWIAELRKPATTGSVSGEVTISRYPLAELPRANVAVRIRGTSYATTTDAKGRYRIDLPPGAYQLEVATDPVIAPNRDQYKFKIAAAGACELVYVEDQYNGRIRGTVRDRSGSPVAGVDVCVARTSETGCLRTVTSDASGIYLATHLAPGDYRVDAGATRKTATVGTGTLVTGIDVVVR